jgi:hypothetical protein
VRYFRRDADGALVGKAWYGKGAAGPPGHALAAASRTESRHLVVRVSTGSRFAHSSPGLQRPVSS